MIPIRDENPTRTSAVVTMAIIAACVVVFAWELLLLPPAREQAILALGFSPARLFSPEGILPLDWPAVTTIFTSMFLHGGVAHLLGNMLYLWIFGNNVEDSMGHMRFIFFYVLCGTAAALAQALPNPASGMPMIGASGAISGVLGAYLILYPRARVLVVIPLGFYPYITFLPAAAVLGLWFLLQALSSALAPATEGGVAWFAHIGGFVAGMALIPLLRRPGVRLFAPRR